MGVLETQLIHLPLTVKSCRQYYIPLMQLANFMKTNVATLRVIMRDLDISAEMHPFEECTRVIRTTQAVLVVKHHRNPSKPKTRTQIMPNYALDRFVPCDIRLK